jgi:2-dehydro-3-deoxy-D-gluconate 5-dehydrogenase
LRPAASRAANGAAVDEQAGGRDMRRFDLAGRVAVVTGGNGGIGLGMARGLAECGAVVVVAGRNAAKNEAAVAELAALGGAAAAAASAVIVDVTDEEQCRAMVAEAVRRHGRLDILVNNAGRAIGKQPHEFPMAEWRAVMDANLTSVVMCSQAAYPEMKRAGGGKVVNVASLAAVLAMPTMAAYAPSKAGVVQFSRVCAAAWARDNIQVNAVLPGWIETDMTRPRREDAGFNERVLARVPAGRWGTPDDLAGIAAFLAGPASDFVTGAAIPVDGGYSFAV